jgi:hypothetical protein
MFTRRTHRHCKYSLLTASNDLPWHEAQQTVVGFSATSRLQPSFASMQPVSFGACGITVSVLKDRAIMQIFSGGRGCPSVYLGRGKNDNASEIRRCLTLQSPVHTRTLRLHADRGAVAEDDITIQDFLFCKSWAGEGPSGLALASTERSVAIGLWIW